LLKKFAEDKSENANLGPMIGTMGGITLSSLLSPSIASIFTSKVIPEAQDNIRSPEFFNKTLKETESSLFSSMPGAAASEISEKALSVTRQMRADAAKEFIHKAENPYFMHAQNKMGKASKKAMLASIGVGLTLPLLGSYIGSKVQHKLSEPTIV
jgi:hypothetical protein